MNKWEVDEHKQRNEKVRSHRINNTSLHYLILETRENIFDESLQEGSSYLAVCFDIIFDT